MSKRQQAGRHKRSAFCFALGRQVRFLFSLTGLTIEFRKAGTIMGNPENIRQYQFTSDQNREEAAKNGRKGGKRSGEVRSFQAEVNKLLKKKPTGKVKKFLEEMGIPEGSQNHRTAIIMAMICNAESGDKPSADWVRDTAGEKPTEKLQHSGSIDTGTEMLADILRQLSEK